MQGLRSVNGPSGIDLRKRLPGTSFGVELGARFHGRPAANPPLEDVEIMPNELLCQRFVISALVVAVFLSLLPGLLLAQDKPVGSLQGKITDKETEEEIAFADIILVGTGKGAISRADGSFIFVQIPEGYYQVRVNRMGYKSEVLEQVKIEAGYSQRLHIKMDPIAVREVETIEVSGDRELVDVEVAQTSRYVTAEDIEDMAVSVVSDVVGKQAGVIEEDGEIFVRGSRASDTVYRIDGVVQRDLITGGSSAGNLSARSVQTIEVLTGGFAAEYGQALGGVVNITTKQGSDIFQGAYEYKTDHFPGATGGARYSNMDDFEIQAEGPEPFSKYVLAPLGVEVPGKLSYFLDVSGEFSDTYLDVKAADGSSNTLNSNYVDNFLGFDVDYGSSMWPRAENRWQGLYKLSWQANGKNKLNLSFSKTLLIDHGFFRSSLLSRADPSSSSTNYAYEWSKRKDHDDTITDDTNLISLDWRKIWNKRTTSTLRLSRSFNSFFQNVYGKPWYAYEEPNDLDLPPELNNTYFIDSGDDDVWHNRYTEAWVGYFDVGYTPNKMNSFKGGFEVSYENLQFITISEPWVKDSDGLGRNHDLWHVYPTTGSGYIQNHFNYEGFIGDVGVRMDYWFPGLAAENALEDTSRSSFNQGLLDEFRGDTRTFFGRRVKANVLPRFAVSHPITDRSHLFFNYGHFSQRPNYVNVYSKISSVSSEDFPIVGNLNLNPQREVKYELGARHQFTDNFAADFSVFFNDIYDYPKSSRFERPGRAPIFIYINEDFARSRGIEFEVRKKRSKYIWASASYTYSIATGKASDPNQTNLLQEEVGAFTQIGRDEEFLSWNRPHKLSLDLTFRVGQKTTPPELFGWTLPQDWSLNMYLWMQSGSSYTPEDILGRELAKRNSANAPINKTINTRFSKGFQTWNKRLEFGLDIRNLLNQTYSRRIDPVTGEAWEIGEGSLDRPADNPLSETERIQYNNPSYQSSPRSIRLGIAGGF